MKLSGLLRRAAPLLVAGIVGAALDRYVEVRFRPRAALPSPAWPPVPVPPAPPSSNPFADAEVHAYRVADEEMEPAAPVAVAVTAAEEEAGAEAFEDDAIDPDGVEPPDDELDDEQDPPGERPSTVDFEALAGHPALSHEPPAADPPELAVRAAIADVGVVHAAAVSVEVHDGVAYLRGEVGSAAAIGAMQRRAAEVSEIRAVENLMHLPDMPLPLEHERG